MRGPYFIRKGAKCELVGEGCTRGPSSHQGQGGGIQGCVGGAGLDRRGG